MAIISNLEAIYTNAEDHRGDPVFNAHLRDALFAKAPELMALLKAAEAIIETFDPPTMNCGGCPYCNLRNAVAAVKGN